jgi:hypothetical protein
MVLGDAVAGGITSMQDIGSEQMTTYSLLGRITGIMLIFSMGASLTGCGLVALPFRTTSAVVKVVPVAGHVAAAPLDATANTID